MTQSYANRVQLAAQGALQAIIEYGAGPATTGTGYQHKIEILTNLAIFIETSWLENGSPIYKERCSVDLTGTPRSDSLKAGWDAAFKNILTIEHRMGRCVA